MFECGSAKLIADAYYLEVHDFHPKEFIPKLETPCFYLFHLFQRTSRTNAM